MWKPGSSKRAKTTDETAKKRHGHRGTLDQQPIKQNKNQNVSNQCLSKPLLSLSHLEWFEGGVGKSHKQR